MALAVFFSHPSKVLTGEEFLNLPPVLNNCPLQKGLVVRHRPDRLRQIAPPWRDDR